MKGMVLVDGLPETKSSGSKAGGGSAGDKADQALVCMPKACREFEANVIILHHSTTICCGYHLVSLLPSYTPIIYLLLYSPYDITPACRDHLASFHYHLLRVSRSLSPITYLLLYLYTPYYIHPNIYHL